MNEPLLTDPQLQSLEARLAALPPQESSARQQALLYQCAFTAGESSAQRIVRRWQAAAATLAVLLVGTSITLTRNQFLVARHKVEPAAPQRAIQPQPPLLAKQEAPPSAHEPAPVKLDAWQVPSSASASLDEELALFQQSDAGLRSLAVGTLTRAALGQ